MKKIIAAILIAILLVGSETMVFADSDLPTNVIDIYVNGKVVTNYYDNQRAFFDTNGRCQVPLRTLAEAMGFTVDYDNKTKTITIPMEGGKKVTLKINSNKVQTPNGEITMDTKTILINERAYVPIRFVAEALGWNVGYKQLKDNSGASVGRATHMITVDKVGTSDTTTTNGIMKDGVLNPKNADLSQNEYLLEFMKDNYAPNTYVMYGTGPTYDSFGHAAEGQDTIFFACDQVNGYWYSQITNFQENKERPIIKTWLDVVTGDSEALYNRIISMYDAPENQDEIIKKYNFGTWQTVGKTNYMFDTTSSKLLLIKIKY